MTVRCGFLECAQSIGPHLMCKRPLGRFRHHEMKIDVRQGAEKRGDAAVKDAAIIAAAQKCEHYEISGYGTARTFADKLGFDDAADLLQNTLDEEGATDKKLTSLAEGNLFKTGINERAVAD